MATRSVTCDILADEQLLCNGTVYHVAEHKLVPQDAGFWMYIGIYVCLVLGAGMMSGLTIGLLSLDLLSLQVLSDSGSGQTRRYAKRLFPIIRRHHWLLVTLLLGNAACVEAMPIFLDRVSDPVTAVLVSVTAVLFFGEVIPQALCTRYGLAIGYYSSPLVYACLLLLSPIAYPIAKLLDCILGADHQTMFKREELKSLVGLHGPQVDNVEADVGADKKSAAARAPPPGNETESADTDANAVLTREEVTVIRGALELASASAGDACTDIGRVFMLSDTERLTRSLRRRVAASAHSRIPIFHATDRDDIRGHLLVKMVLLLFDCEEDVPLETLMADSRFFRQIPFVPADTALFDLLKIFQQGKSHMAVVLSSRQPTKVRGVITLENVLERLLMVEIKDEADEIREELEGSLRRAALAASSSSRRLRLSRSSHHRRQSSAKSATSEATPLLAS